MPEPKPQIVSYDFGRHNADPSKAASRILESGSWKDQSTIMLIPSAAMVPAKAALSWMNLICPPNNKFFRMLTIGMEVGEAYSAAIEHILAHPDLSQWKFILTVEHDNIPPPDGFINLVKDMEEHPEFSCIGGLYWTKGEDGVPQIWGDPLEPLVNYRPQVPKIPPGIQECCGTGMGFNLWRMQMFKDSRIPRPLFRTKASMAEGVGTQDLAFWGEARKYGYRCAIDTRVLVGHYDVTNDIVW